MLLDKKVPQGFSEPFSILNHEKAERYVGELCWFSNNAKDFMDVNSCTLAYLKYVNPNNGVTNEKIFECEYGDNKYFYRYCIPCNFESSYRPFNCVDELLEHGYDVGKVIVWREKGNVTQETTSMITRIDYFHGNYYSPTSTHIQIGCSISLEDAYRKVEVKVDGKWIPFGVKKDV